MEKSMMEVCAANNIKHDEAAAAAARLSWLYLVVSTLYVYVFRITLLYYCELNFHVSGFTGSLLFSYYRSLCQSHCSSPEIENRTSHIVE